MLTYESPIEFVYDMVDSPNSLISQSEIPRYSWLYGIRYCFFTFIAMF